MKRFAITLLTIALGAIAAIASAAERRPLPAMTLVDATGTPVTTASLSSEPQWMLVYVTPSAPAAERLIEAMKGWDLGTSLRKVVFVVDARGADAQAWVARLLPQTEENLPPRYLDPGGEARTALRVNNAPTLLGIKDGQIAWDLAGVLNDPAALEPVIRNWIEWGHIFLHHFFHAVAPGRPERITLAGGGRIILLRQRPASEDR